MNSNENKAIVNDFERKIGLLVKELEDMINQKVLGIGLEFENVTSIQDKESRYLKTVKIVLEPEKPKRAYRVCMHEGTIFIALRDQKGNVQQALYADEYKTDWIEY